MPAFIDRYVYAMGTTKVPPAYHPWCAMSLLAACAADRVWLERSAGARVWPNLYVLLVGPSGVGKGEAIRGVTGIAKGLVDSDLFVGKSTAQGLRDRLGRPTKDDAGKFQPPSNRVWLVSGELAFSVPLNVEAAFELVAMLTDWYDGGPVPFRDRTRTSGEVVVLNPCINWLAGTTREWLMRVLKGETIRGGFSRRLIVVEEDYVEDVPPDPIFPPDRDGVVDELRAWCRQVTEMRGAFRLDADAARIYRDWFDIHRQRITTADPDMRPWLETLDGLVYKIAMALALSESTTELWITRLQMQRAQQLAEGLRPAVARAVNYTRITEETENFAWLRDLARTAGELDRVSLVRRASSRGILAKELDDYLATLAAGGELTVESAGPRGGRVYKWIGRRRIQRRG